MPQLFINNPQYKHFLCGFTHDNGYVRNIKPYSDRAKQIALLEAGPSALEFRDLPFEKWSFPSVFRSQLFAQQGSLKQSRVIKAARATDSKDSQGQPAGTASAKSTKGAKAPGKKEILLNKKGQRVDPPFLEEVSSETKKALDQREEETGSKWYYDHYLGSCTRPSCPKIHQEQPADDQPLALRYKARILVCPKGSQCRSFDCFRSQMCTFSDCGRGTGCRFRGLHNVDEKVEQTIVPRGLMG